MPLPLDLKDKFHLVAKGGTAFWNIHNQVPPSPSEQMGLRVGQSGFTGAVK